MGAVGRPSDHEPSDGFHLNFNRCVIVKRLIEERLHSLEPSAIPSTGCRKAMFRRDKSRVGEAAKETTTLVSDGSMIRTIGAVLLADETTFQWIQTRVGFSSAQMAVAVALRVQVIDQLLDWWLRRADDKKLRCNDVGCRRFRPWLDTP